MTRLVILPGLDGTASLRHAFTSIIAPHFTAVDLIAYPSDIALDYAELQTWVRDRLPADGNFVLLGESFSGPIAIRLAGERPRELVAMVLAATFATPPVLVPPHWNAQLINLLFVCARNRLRSPSVAAAREVAKRSAAGCARGSAGSGTAPGDPPATARRVGRRCEGCATQGRRAHPPSQGNRGSSPRRALRGNHLGDVLALVAVADAPGPGRR